jgi:hypothetical protein
MSLVVQQLKQLYAKQSPHHEQRIATLQPLATRARELRDAYAAILTQHVDLAHQIIGIDLKQVARFVHPNLLPVVQRLVTSAKKITEAGTTADLMAAIYRAEAGTDAHTDSEYERGIQDVRKYVDLVADSVAALKKDIDVVSAALDIITAAGTAGLKSDTVNVPAPTEGGFINANPKPATSAAK